MNKMQCLLHTSSACERLYFVMLIDVLDVKTLSYSKLEKVYHSCLL